MNVKPLLIKLLSLVCVSILLLCGVSAKEKRSILKELSSPILFAGTDKVAYRDPAILYHKHVFHLFFTLVETEENGHIYSYVAYSKSSDLRHWSPIRKLTAKDQKLNYSSPGNVMKFRNEWILCFQTYPRPDYTNLQKIRYGDETARLYIMRSKDLKTWSLPELLKVKGDAVSCNNMGRMIDPYLIQDKDDSTKYWCFYKQNGVSLSYSYNLKSWTYFGHTSAGENVSVIIDNNEYILFHSPGNGIGIKKSKDLAHWQDWGELITLGQKQWKWALGRITAGTVVDLRNVSGLGCYVMFFHGSGPLSEGEGDFDKNSSIGVAWSYDLVNWSWPKRRL